MNRFVEFTLTIRIPDLALASAANPKDVFIRHIERAAEEAWERRGAKTTSAASLPKGAVMRFAGAEAHGGRVVAMLFEDTTHRGFGPDAAEIPSSFITERQVLEPLADVPDEVAALYQHKPVIHVMDGVTGVQSLRDDTGQLHVFVSPLTHRRLEHRAILADGQARVWAEVRNYEPPRYW